MVDPVDKDPVAPALRAYQDGDYRRARALVDGLERSALSPDALERVGQLRRSMGADRVQAGVLGACLVVLLCVIGTYFL